MLTFLTEPADPDCFGNQGVCLKFIDVDGYAIAKDSAGQLWAFEIIRFHQNGNYNKGQVIGSLGDGFLLSDLTCEDQTETFRKACEDAWEEHSKAS